MLGPHREVAGVVKAMRRIDPSIKTKAEAGNHAVGVLFITQRAKEDGAFVGLPVAICVLKEQDIRDAPHDAAVLVRQHSGGNVEVGGEDGDLVGAAIAVSILKDADGVLTARRGGGVGAPFVLLYGEGILLRAGDPEATAGVKGHVDGLATELRVISEELNFKAFGHMETLQLLLRGALLGAADEAIGILLQGHDWDSEK